MNNNVERNENDSIFDNIEPIDLTFVDTKEDSDFIKDPSFNIFNDNINDNGNIQNLNQMESVNEFNNMGLNDLVNKSIENMNQQEEKGSNFNNNGLDNFTNYNMNSSNENNEFSGNNISNSFDFNQNDIIDSDNDIEIIDDYINQEDNSYVSPSENLESFNVPNYNENIVQNNIQNKEFMDDNFTQSFESFNQATIDLTNTKNENNIDNNNEQMVNNDVNSSDFINFNLSTNEEPLVSQGEFNNTNKTEENVINPMEFNNNNLSTNEEIVTNPVEFSSNNLSSIKETSENKNEMSDEVLLKKAVRELIILGVIIAITIVSLPTIYDIVKGNDNFVTDFINNVKGS